MFQDKAVSNALPTVSIGLHNVLGARSESDVLVSLPDQMQ